MVGRACNVEVDCVYAQAALVDYLPCGICPLKARALFNIRLCTSLGHGIRLLQIFRLRRGRLLGRSVNCSK